MEKASVGRIVHYVSYGTPNGEYASQCRAAIITEVDGESFQVGLAVLNPTGLFFRQGVMADFTENQGGTWHWPERVSSLATGGIIKDPKTLIIGE